jgi:dTDP-4-amino-4,6-dideoxygalactose transaminase
MKWQIPLSDIDFGPEEEEVVQQVIRRRWLTMGSVTQAFEQAFASHVGAKHAIAVSNGTAALHLACLAAGLGPGDEVIVPSLTFVATAAAIRYVGAQPIFADVTSLDDPTISPSSIEQLVTERTAAIIVMHYGGYACNMPRIMSLARQRGLAVIEDAAHAPGAALEGRLLGTWGDVGCFSFFSNKNLVTGEGGMLVTDDDALAGKLRLQRSHGMTTLTWDRQKGHACSYDVVELGYNYRIDEIRASLGLSQLGKLDRNNQRRRDLTAAYHRLLSEASQDVIVPFSHPQGEPSCHIMPVLLPEWIDRTYFMEVMKSQGIQTSMHYPPIHQFQYYKDQPAYVPMPLTATEDFTRHEVTLPLYPTMGNEQVEYVVHGVRHALEAARTDSRAKES